ncbi:MAG: hypothetical protein V7K38_19405 [Nostoc sp.]|uniref:hypothetical protein n=1 Tax=Nostoc sp. TaxID=1180 RepID=UPI002FF72E80
MISKDTDRVKWQRGQLLPSALGKFYLKSHTILGVQLDLDDLIEEVIPQTFRRHGSHHFTQTATSTDSVAAPVQKENIFAMLESVKTIEDVHRLAGDENVQKWVTAIANYLINVKDEISLTKLQQGLEMPMVEVWLGLLLGGFTLEQRGDFYNSQDIWVMRSSSKSLMY